MAEPDAPFSRKLTTSLRLWRALRLVWQSSRRWTLATLLLMPVRAFLPLVSLYLMKRIVDSLSTGAAAGEGLSRFAPAAYAIGLMAAVTLLSSLANSAASLVSQVQTLEVSDFMRRVVHAKSISLDLAHYEIPQYYDTFQRAQREAAFRPMSVVQGLLNLGQNSFSLAALVGLLSLFHWSIALVLLLAVLPDLLVKIGFSKKVFRWQRLRTPLERQTNYFDFLLTGAAHAKEIRLNQLGPLFMDHFSRLRRRLRQEQMSLHVSRAVAGWGAQILSILVIFGTYAAIALQTAEGRMSLGDLVMYFQAFQRAQTILQDMLGGLNSLYEDNLFLANLEEFLDLQPSVTAPSAPKAVPRPIREGWILDRVSFCYPESQRQALCDVSLHIPPGQVVALVGENGSGKTTLVKLLCRLYDPTGGTIRLDGSDLREFDPDELRREIGVVFQDFAQYHLTIRENIRLGDTRLPEDDPRIEAAAREAGLAGLLSRLPRGDQTPLGKWFDQGEELSLGEWQKVALARAFLRDTQMVILDEPTSSLDARAEYELFCKFRQLVAGRTAILISHRFSTVRLADCIYVLQEGRICESGSHEDLMDRQGVYARMFETQAQFYR